DDMEPVAGRPRHQKPAIVGAEIERPIDRAAVVRPALGPLATRKAIKRPPTPAGTPLHPFTGRVEVTGPPGLVIHRMPSCRARALPALARRRGGVQFQVNAECNRRDAVRNRCTRRAWLAALAPPQPPLRR